MASRLATLLQESFGDVQELPERCWVRLAVAEDQEDFGTVIEAVDDCGERASLIRRMTAEHPTSRRHHEQHDDRLLDVFTEAEALAWGRHVGGLGCCRFVFAEGAPDLRCDAGWVEVKRLSESDVEKAELAGLEPQLERDGMIMRGPRRLGSVPAVVFRQLDAKLTDAIQKWERQQRSLTLTTFFDVRIDFGFSIRGARDDLRAWGTRESQRTGARIVICYMDAGDWRHPLLDTKSIRG